MIAVHHDNEVVNALRLQLKAAQRMARYYKGKSSTLQGQLVQVRQESQQLVAKINVRPGSRNVSTFGGYSLAIKRNAAGHVGAAAAAQLVAGDDFRGGLHDKNIVLKYEHRAACAKRCRAFQECAEFIDNIDFGKEDIDISFEVFSYKRDATNQEATECAAK